MKTNYTNNGVDIKLEICNCDIWDEQDPRPYVDFLVYFEKCGDENYSLYLQVDLDEENHVCALNGRDNMDDYGLLPKFIDDDELMADMNKELDEYKKYLDGLK